MCYNIGVKKKKGESRKSERNKIMTVINRNGKEISFEVAQNYMDDELCESLDYGTTFETEQEFFSAYEDLHEEKFCEEWELSKANPCF